MVSRKLAVKLIKLLGTAPHSFEELCHNQTEHVQDNLDRIDEIFLIFFRFEGLKEQSSENEEISQIYDPKHARTARAAGKFFYLITRSISRA